MLFSFLFVELINVIDKKINIMESNAKPINGHYETIICPNCKSHELAFVEYTFPWNTMIHHCRLCEYIIMENEWNKVKPKP